MTIVESTGRFVSGMRYIERAIILGLRDIGVDAAVPTFRWHRGGAFIPPPEATTLEAAHRGMTWNAVLSRDQIEACCARVERADVARLVNDAVKRLSNGASSQEGRPE